MCDLIKEGRQKAREREGTLEYRGAHGMVLNLHIYGTYFLLKSVVRITYLIVGIVIIEKLITKSSDDEFVAIEETRQRRKAGSFVLTTTLSYGFSSPRRSPE